MIILNPAVGFNEEYEKLGLELQKIQASYTVLLEKYAELNGTIKPNIEAEYMLKIGRKEYQLFACQIQILQYKREISLLQRAQNRHEKISSAEVKKMIAQEFQAYQKQLHDRQKQLDAAKKRLGAEPLSPEETQHLKKLYHKLAQLLHPDLNPDLPSEYRNLWCQVTAAYQDADVAQLELLLDLAEEIHLNQPDLPPELNAEEVRKQRIKKLKLKGAELNHLIAEMQTQPPFTWRDLLTDPEKLQRRRQELDQQLKVLDEQLQRFKAWRDQLTQGL